MTTLTVAVSQYGLTHLESEQAFWERLRLKISDAALSGAELAVFPEYVTAHLLSLQPVMTHDEACRRLDAYTEQYRAFFQRCSREFQLVILGGTHICKLGSGFVNRAFLFFPDGRIEIQDKIHLTPEEQKRWALTPGDELNVIDTKWGKWAMLTCYDIEFPELARMAAEREAALLLCPSYTDTAHGYSRVRLCAQARSIENQLFVALSGMVGTLPEERPQVDQGYCQAGLFTPCDLPFTEDGIIATGELNADSLVIGKLDFAKLQANRDAGAVAPFYDRRPDFYTRVRAVADAR
jgi:predicted amidohydrolase